MSTDLEAQGLALAATRMATAARESLPVYNRAGLAAWHAALAHRDAAPAKVVWLGDSITEGASAPAYGSRWVDRALARLRQDHPVAGVTGGVNFLPAFMVDATLLGSPKPQGQPWTAQHGGGKTFETGWGLGGKVALLNWDGDGFTYAFTGTSCGVMYQKGGGLGSLSIEIDGGAATYLSCDGVLGTYLWQSLALTRGAHSITVTRNGPAGAGGNVYFDGVLAFDGDEAAGVQGYEAGHCAWTAGDFAAPPNGMGASYLWGGVQVVAPQLVTIALGTNDYAVQVAPAVFRANLQTVIAAVRAAAPACSIALIAYGRPGHVAVQPIGWDQYVRALYEVTDADTGGINGGSGVAVIDLSARLPWATPSGAPVDPLGLYTADRVHPGAKGHAAIGEMVGAALGL